MAYEMIDVYVEVIDDGKDRRAIKVSDDGTRAYWLPKSQIRKRIHIEGRTYRLIIPRWLAHQKGLI